MSNKFYNPKRINSKQATYNLIIGERSNGKTYALLYQALKNYFENGKQFAYVRRWHEDVTGRRASSIFSGLIENGVIEKLSQGEYTSVYYYNGKYFLCNYEKGKVVYNDRDVLGHTFALSENEHNKSNSYPNVTLIIFDEFLTKGTYLPDEFVLFMNTISTIIRLRTNVKIYMLGNTVNKYSPYFREMGLNHIKDMNQGDIDVYNYGKSKLKVAVEFTNSTKSNKKNNFYFAFNNPRLNMIKNGSWELNLYPHNPINFKRSDIDFIYFIKFNDDLFQCEVVNKEPYYFTFIHRKTTPIKDKYDLVYSLEYNPKINYIRNIFKPINKLESNILWYYINERVYYQSNDVGDAIANYLSICRKE